MLYGNNTWYLVLRLYYILCDRLAYFQSHAEKAIVAAAAEQKSDTVETAYALCLKTPSECLSKQYLITGCKYTRLCFSAALLPTPIASP